MKKNHNTTINYSKYLPKEHKKKETQKPTHAPEEIKKNYADRIARLENKLTSIDNKKRDAVKKTKEKYNVLFGRSFGWIFITLGFLVPFLLLGSDYKAVDYIAWGVVALIALAYFIFQGVYSRSHTRKELVARIEAFEKEENEIKRKIIELKEKVKNIPTTA